MQRSSVFFAYLVGVGIGIVTITGCGSSTSSLPTVDIISPSESATKAQPSRKPLKIVTPAGAPKYCAELAAVLVGGNSGTLVYSHYVEKLDQAALSAQSGGHKKVSAALYGQVAFLLKAQELHSTRNASTPEQDAALNVQERKAKGNLNKVVPEVTEECGFNPNKVGS